ncbi:MAG: (p)ppGpp synthetase [Treponema sp.]|jgi:putative GTP pyrophosphokinase|nr:(p)ppGpp synthetase [Treponema sp.]
MSNFKVPDQKILRNIYEQYGPARVLISKDIEAGIETALKTLPSRPTIKGRVKEFGSYYKKYLKILKNVSPETKPPFITDIIGLRIVCPFFGDLAIVQNRLKETFEIIEVELKGSDYSFKEFGYESIHLLIKIPETIMKNRGDCGLEVAEIQIRTILQDAWAEVEHELVYKAEFTPFDELMKRKLAAVNASLSLADTIFQEIRTYQQNLNGELGKRRNSFFKKVQESTDNILFAPELVGSLALKHTIHEPLDTGFDSGDPLYNSDSGETIGSLILKALSAHNKNHFKEAIAYYTHSLKMEPNNIVGSLIYKHRGMANFARSQYDESIMDFTKSLELDPQSYKAVYYRGVVKAVLQQYLEAIDDFTFSLKINPYYAFSFYRRGQAYYHIEDIPQALADCEAALALEPDIIEFHRFKELLFSQLLHA